MHKFESKAGNHSAKHLQRNSSQKPGSGRLKTTSNRRP